MDKVKSDKTIIITGTGQRLGAIIAQDLAHDFTISAHYHKLPPKNLSWVWQADFQDPERTLQELAKQDLSQVTGVIHNAAIFEKDDFATCNSMTLQRHLQINALSPILINQYLSQHAPRLEHIIHILDYKVTRIDPFYFSYTLSKTLLYQASQSMAQSLAPKIKVNNIALGAVLPDHNEPEKFSYYCEKSPLKQSVSVQDILQCLRFILNSQSITGHTFMIDGGKHLGFSYPL